MQVKVEAVSAVEKKVGVEIPWMYVSQKLDEAYRDLSRGVSLKGFRKGKVPRPILEKMFSQQVERDVVQKLVQESFLAAAHQHDIQPVAEPVVDDARLTKGQPFQYSARVEVRSEVEPKDYFGVEVSKRAPKVTDEQVQAAVEHKRDELTEYKVIEGREPAILRPSDVAVLSVKGTIGAQKVEKDGVMVDLGAPEGDPREPLPGISNALRGAPLNAVDHEITVTFPDPNAEAKQEGKEVAQVTARLKVTIKEAREKQVPALDDEFAKDTGEADTLADLKEKLRLKLVAEDEKEIEQEVKRDLIKELIKRNKFAVAPALIERQLDVMIQRSKMQLAMRGVDPRNANLDERRMRDDLRETAHDEVSAAFLIDAIATKEKVEASDAEFEKKLAELAQARDKSVPRLKADLQKEGRLDALRHQLKEEKTLDLLLQRAQIRAKDQ